MTTDNEVCQVRSKIKRKTFGPSTPLTHLISKNTAAF